jgi:hypothetical protein
MCEEMLIAFISYHIVSKGQLLILMVISAIFVNDLNVNENEKSLLVRKAHVKVKMLFLFRPWRANSSTSIL